MAVAQPPPSEFRVTAYPNKMLTTSSHAVSPSKGRQLSLSADDVRSLHFMAMNGSVKHRGEFRRGPVLLGGGIFFPPSWREVPALMSEFCMYLNTEWGGGDVFHLGALRAIWRLSAIHPFEDGNGRVARSLCFALMRAKNMLRWRGCCLDRRKYVARLKQADRLFEETHDVHLSTTPVERGG